MTRKMPMPEYRFRFPLSDDPAMRRVAKVTLPMNYSIAELDYLIESLGEYRDHEEQGQRDEATRRALECEESDA